MPRDGEKREGIRKENQIRRGHGEKEKRRRAKSEANPNSAP